MTKIQVGRHGRIVRTHATSEEAKAVLTVLLKNDKNWMYASEVQHAVGWKTQQSISQRAIRSVCQTTNMAITSSKGYKHIFNTTFDERDAFAIKLSNEANSKLDRLHDFQKKAHVLAAQGKLS